MQDDSATADGKPRDFVTSLEHGLSVLSSFDAANASMSLSQVADRVGMTRAGARRYLLTLAHMGFIRRDGRSFRLTSKVLSLGYSYLSALPFSDFAMPLLEQASAASEQTIALAVRDGAESVYTARAIPQRALAVTVPVGRRLPLVSTSTGRAMLAFDSPEAIDRLIESSHPVQLTDKTTVDPQVLRRQLDLVRSRGYALVEQEVEVGVRSLAVPIFDNRHKVAGAVTALTSMSAITSRQLLSDVFPIVRQTANELENALKAGRGDVRT